MSIFVSWLHDQPVALTDLFRPPPSYLRHLGKARQGPLTRIAAKQPEGYPKAAITRGEEAAVKVEKTDKGNVYSDVLVYRGDVRHRHSVPGSIIRMTTEKNGVGRPPWLNRRRDRLERTLIGLLKHGTEQRTVAAMAAQATERFVKAYNALRPVLYAEAVKIYGSQRKAAAVLGLNLSTFQRRLKKELAAA